MTETTTRTAAGITEIGTVTVPVSDQDRAIDFYVDKLGFEKRADVPFGDGMRWIEMAPPGASTGIALMPPREGDPVGVETRIGLITADIDATHASVRAAGVKADDEVTRMGEPVPPMFFFDDQDGNRLFLVEAY